MADEPRLNSLARFRKQPARLVLEEHGRCEVPAGCGGVVLRWRNPRAAVHFTLFLYTPTPADCRLDGAAVQTGRVDLAPGTHVLTVALAGVDLTGALLQFAATSRKEYQGKPAAGVVERPCKVVSRADGSWKYTLSPPPEGWAAPAFDDRAWPALEKVPTPQLAWDEHGAHQAYGCNEAKATCLGLPIPDSPKARSAWWQRLLGHPAPPGQSLRGDVWVRKVFEVPGPEVADAPTA